MDAAVTAVLAFLVLLAGIVALRIRTREKVEIKTPDIVMALIPVALWLLLTGRIQELTVGDVKIVASAITEASESPVAAQVTRLSELPVQPVETSPKGGVASIPEIRKRKSQALSFRLEHGGYNGPAIREYLDSLTETPFLRYLVITYPDGKFFGMADARELAGMMRGPTPTFDTSAFAQALNRGEKAELEALPGFVSVQKALKKTADKRKALEAMQKLDLQTLPVVDDEGRFVGTVDRSKLAASILIDIAERIERK